MKIMQRRIAVIYITLQRSTCCKAGSVPGYHQTPSPGVGGGKVAN